MISSHHHYRVLRFWRTGKSGSASGIKLRVPHSDKPPRRFSNTPARAVPLSGWIRNEVLCSVSIICTGDSSRVDKFETLCDIKADISTAPYETKYGKSGKVYHERRYSVILLVGFTELKAQIGWIDSGTVSSPRIPSRLPFRLIFVMHGSRERRKGQQRRFQSPSFPKAEFTFQKRRHSRIQQPLGLDRLKGLSELFRLSNWFCLTSIITMFIHVTIVIMQRHGWTIEREPIWSLP